MDSSSVPLREITGYFDFWRQVKQECINETELLKVFATLASFATLYSHSKLSMAAFIQDPVGNL